MGDREPAEDILQDAFIKVMDRPDQAPAGEGLVPWFYRTLRNAAIDRFRRREAAGRAVEAFHANSKRRPRRNLKSKRKSAAALRD